MPAEVVQALRGEIVTAADAARNEEIRFGVSPAFFQFSVVATVLRATGWPPSGWPSDANFSAEEATALKPYLVVLILFSGEPDVPPVAAPETLPE